MTWWIYIYIYIYLYINIDRRIINHRRRQWRYKPTAIKYRSPQLRLKCAQGRDYTYKYSCRYRKPATFPFPLMSTASLRVVGHECHTPLRSFTSLQMVHAHIHKKCRTNDKLPWSRTVCMCVCICVCSPNPTAGTMDLKKNVCPVILPRCLLSSIFNALFTKHFYSKSVQGRI